MDNNKEIRMLAVELRADTNSRIIEGKCIPFNVFSPNWEGFIERILPEAVDGVLEISDIFMLLNHDNSKGFLARNKKGKGSLQYEVREDGVYVMFDCPTDNLGEYVYQRVKKGELDEMSFAFTIESDVWEKGADGVYQRTITKFNRIYDFSIVDNAYYGSATNVGCKRYAEIQEADKIALEKAQEEERLAQEKLEAEKREQEEAEKAQAIADAHSKLLEEYGNYIVK